MGAKYSYGVWERFARQANTILRGFNKIKKTPLYRQIYVNIYLVTYGSTGQMATWKMSVWIFKQTTYSIGFMNFDLDPHPHPTPLARGVGLAAVFLLLKKRVPGMLDMYKCQKVST